MKIRQIIIILICIFISSFSCKQQSNEWKGSIEEENGVMVVRNPKEPLHNGNVFNIEEELSIGEAEGREEYMFSQLRSIVIDEEERIYALDYKEAQIKVFNKNGEYLRTIGKKGQGPGELRLPSHMHITSRNEIMVSDALNKRLTFYSLQGEFIRDLSTAEEFIARSDIDSKGNILGFRIEHDPEKSRYELKKFDKDLNYLFTIITFPYKLPNPRIIEPFSLSLRYDVANNDNIIVGYPDKYNIQIFNSEGKLIRRIEKEYIPIEITKDEIIEIEEEMKRWLGDRELVIPRYHSAYRTFAVDEENRIFVGTWERTEDGKRYYYDVFDSEGKCLAIMPLNVRPWIWKKKKLYTVEEDEEGYQVVKRYKVTWNIEK